MKKQNVLEKKNVWKNSVEAKNIAKIKYLKLVLNRLKYVPEPK